MLVERKTILHLEDDASVAAVVARMLKDAGYYVVTAYNVPDALRSLNKNKPNLVIVDVNMTGMSGLTLIDRLRGPDGKSGPPILIFTAFTAMVDESARQKAAAVLEKPTDVKALIEEVKRLLSSAPQPQAG